MGKGELYLSWEDTQITWKEEEDFLEGLRVCVSVCVVWLCVGVWRMADPLMNVFYQAMLLGLSSAQRCDTGKKSGMDSCAEIHLKHRVCICRSTCYKSKTSSHPPIPVHPPPSKMFKFQTLWNLVTKDGSWVSLAGHGGKQAKNVGDCRCGGMCRCLDGACVHFPGCGNQMDKPCRERERELELQEKILTYFWALQGWWGEGGKKTETKQ